VDRRAGSVELMGPLKAEGLAPELDTLPAGDVEIVGLGPGGRPLLIGVEIKTIPDVLACVRNGRFAEQLRGMRARYEVRWLLIEGEWRIEDDELEVRERRGYRARGGYAYQEVAAWGLTMAQRGGVLLWRTKDREESVAWLRAMYWWWTSKDFEEHRAHLAWYTPPATCEAMFEEPGLVQRVAAILPGIGAERAYAASQAFGSVRSMVCADEKAWRAVDGIGPKTARRVVEAVQ
jgi:ERCC4-type nuclease